MYKLLFILFLLPLCSNAQKMVSIDTTYESYAHYIDTIYDVQWYLAYNHEQSITDTTFNAWPITAMCRHDVLIHLYGKGYSKWYWFYRDKENPDAYYTRQIYLIGYKQYNNPFITIH